MTGLYCSLCISSRFAGRCCLALLFPFVVVLRGLPFLRLDCSNTCYRLLLLVIEFVLTWCVSLFFVYMAIPEPTPCSFLLPSVYMWIV